MTSTPFIPRRPAKYDEQVFQRYLRILPTEALEHLERIMEGAQDKGTPFNLIAVCHALYAGSSKEDADAVPAIPIDLHPFAQPELNEGREYALQLGVGAYDQHGQTRIRKRYIRELRQVRDLVATGMDVVDAWRRVARRSDLDEAMTTPPDRRNRERIF